MSELAPVYSGGHSFAVMEPLAVSGSPNGAASGGANAASGGGFTQMIQLTAGAGTPQFIQTANGQILQVMTAQTMPQVSI